MTVLVLGWQRAVVAALTAEAVDYVVLAGRSRWHRADDHPHAPRWVPVLDHCDVEEVLPVALQLQRSGVRLHAVYTQDEYAIVTAAAVASALHAAFLPVTTAVNFRHKPTQKHLLRHAGLPVADWESLSVRPAVAQGQLRAFGSPLVVKPVDGAGTALTEAASSDEQLARLMDGWCDRAESSHVEYVAERMIYGRECHLDGIVEDGAVRLFAVSRYRRNLLTIRSGGLLASMIVDPLGEPELWSTARVACARAVAALGLQRGPFHLEVFDTGDELVFGECAARIGGAYTAQMISHGFGFDLFSETARQLAGRQLGGDLRRPGAVGYTALPAPLGRLVRAPTEQELLGWPGVLDVKIEMEPGKPVPDTTASTTSRPGLLLLAARDDAELIARMDEYAGRFRDLCVVA